MRLRVFLPLVISGLAAMAPALAQSTFGSIIGSVQDKSGATAPGTNISITNLAENTSSQTRCNDRGLYHFVNLQPGRYSITAESPGFAVARIPEILLEARQERRADIVLDVASVQETVEVTAEATAINTENGTISDTKNFAEVTQLPLNYRGATTSSLAVLNAVPGVQQDGQGNYSVGGGFPSMTDFTLDGISTVNVNNNGPNANMFPSSEMISEFRVSSVSNNAELPNSGDVTVITKSGSNSLHGSLFEYWQNRALDATTYGSAEKQAKVYNTFGGSLGGPVVIPKLYNGHNKTFFFVDYEGNQHPGSTLQQFNVPTASMRSGNLDGLPGDAAVDPSNGLPFPNNVIPNNRLSAVSQKFLADYYPTPNFDSGSTVANYRTLIPSPITTNGYDFRIDQHFGSKQQLYGRFSWKNYHQIQPDNILPSETIFEQNRNLVISHNYTARPNLINEFRFGISHWKSDQKFPLNGVDVVKNLGLTGLDLSKHPESGGFTGFDFSDGTGFTSAGTTTQSGVPKDGPLISDTRQFTDNLSWIVGRHTMKFGTDIRFLDYHDVQHFGGSDDFGAFVFNAGAFSGNAFTDFLLGLPASNYVAVTGPDLVQQVRHFAFYAQDEFRINSKLTVNIGLRWEFQPPFTESHGNITNFDPATNSVVVPDKTLPASQAFLFTINAPCPGIVSTLPCSNLVPASKMGLPQGLRANYFGSWDPRFSIAYRPFGNSKTVLRGGFGLFSMTSLGRVAYALTGIHTTDARTFVNFNAAGIPPVYQFPAATGGSLDPSAIGSGEFIVAVNEKYRDPQSAQWNFTVEHELPSSFSLRLSYIGMNSYRLPLFNDMDQLRPSAVPFNQANTPFPNWASIIDMQNVAFANYQSFQTELDHRYGNGLFLQATYNLTKSLTNAGGDAPAAFPSEVGGWAQMTDQYNTRNIRGNDYGTRRHRLLVSAMYQLPFGKGRKWLTNSPKLVGGALGGWELSTISLFQTGPWQTVTDSPTNDQANLNVLLRGVTVRPDRIGNGNLSNPTSDLYYDINAFAPTPAGAGRTGNSGVGILQGPGTVTVAAGLSKSFKITEHSKLRFEGTFTNIFNHPNFIPPSVDFASPSTFGVTTQVQTAESGGNRSGQLAMRLDF